MKHWNKRLRKVGKQMVLGKVFPLRLWVCYNNSSCVDINKPKKKKWGIMAVLISKRLIK